MSKQKTALIYVVLILGILITTMFSVRDKSTQPNTNILLIGTSPDYPPFEFKENNKIVGLDIDLAKLIAQKLNMQPVILEFEFPNLIPALQSGKIDIIASALTATQERKSLVDFSEAYYVPQFAMITNAESNITNLEQFKHKKIGAQLGSTMQLYLTDNKDKLQIKEIVTLNSNNQLIQQLKLNRIDGTLVEEAQAKSFVFHDRNLKYFQILGSEYGYSFALKKGSDLTSKINQAILELKQEGKIEQLYSKWIDNNSHQKSSLSYAIKYISMGVTVTLKYTIISVTFGLLIGVALSLCKLSKYKTLNYAANIYTSIFRGTPLLVQLSLIYFALPAILNIDLSIFASGIIAFSLNSGAYVSEIIRAGINAVDKGQFEAAKAHGIPYHKMMRDIIMPQAIRKILPSLVNEMINMLKESAIISTIGETDIMRRSQIIAAEQYSYLEPILVAASCYYILVMILSYIAKKLEERLSIQ